MMDWPALLSALKPYGFRESTVVGFDAYRDRDYVRIQWWPGGKPQVMVMPSLVELAIGRPPLFSGSPEETVEWFKQREG